MAKHEYSITLKGDHICGRFSAMASPCEVLFDCTDLNEVEAIFVTAVNETKRIEAKYSRYSKGNELYRINNNNGCDVKIDEETALLLNFADTCYQISNGKFDISSGVLRKAWTFDGSDNIPNKKQISALQPFVGWSQVYYDGKVINLPRGFELDLGGIGKEYAVSKVAQMLSAALPNISILVNFGGDIQVTRPRKNKPYWQIGIENPTKENGVAIVNIAKGGLATSGDANRFLLKNGKRYSHILNPLTGYPIKDAARSITVASDNCVQAGLLATLAILQGENAESFLDSEGVKYWCYRYPPLSESVS